MQVSFQLALPRDAASVQLTRHLIAQALAVVGVEPDTISDVEIAISEACSNVLRHAKTGDAYEVRVGFDEHRAFLQILDQGEGFDDMAHGHADPEAESGRGVTLMKALMDKVRFESHQGDGSSVILEKQLQWTPGSLVVQLRQQGTAANPA